MTNEELHQKLNEMRSLQQVVRICKPVNLTYESQIRWIATLTRMRHNLRQAKSMVAEILVMKQVTSISLN